MGSGSFSLFTSRTSEKGNASSFCRHVLVTSVVGGVIAALMLSEFRFLVAQIGETAGLREIRDIVLGRSIPYGVAIAVGGWVVGARMLMIAGG